MAITEPGFSLLDDVTRLVLLVKAGIERNELAPLTLCPEIFAEAPRIASDQPVSCLENRRRGAVVLFQADCLGPGKILCEALDIFDSCASPPVDRLIIVTDCNHRNRLTCQHPEPGILNGVGILKLVHQNSFESLLVMLQGLRRLQPQFMGT